MRYKIERHTIVSPLKKAREAGMMMTYSDTATAGSKILDEVAPQSGDPKMTGRTDLTTFR
jgi:hypothetical protein